MHSPPPVHTRRAIDDALAVVHAPHLVHDQPARRLNAWATLMEQRGHGVAVSRLCRMQAQYGLIGAGPVLAVHPGGRA